MPRAKWIDKKNATTFTLVHRSQQDPLVHDADASQMVFKELAPSNQKIKTTADLESEYGDIRENEGEAAMYGIYYDDTEYDYMQHLRDIGGSTEAVFIEAPQADSKQGRKGKEKVSLDEAIREEEEEKKKKEEEQEKPLLPEDVLPSTAKVKRTYQDQQDLPDSLAGFQPDMDPRLREVLEALEDEAYVEEDEEDLFSSLAESGETNKAQFEDSQFDFEDDAEDEVGDGWESDATEKATEREKLREKVAAKSELPAPETVGADELAADSAEVNNDWQREFAKFKKDTRKSKKGHMDDSSSIGAGTATTAMSLGAAELSSLLDSRNNRKQKKKKIPSSSRTATSGYSMSSSALHRTEGLTLLDDRFDRIEEEYAREDDEDDEDMRSQFTTGSIIEDERQDFNSILDEFLGGYSTTGKKQRRVKRGKQMSGLEQLDEIRRELGPARVATR